MASAVVADARVLFAAYGMPRGEVSVVLCGDAFIQTLNLRWRGLDAPTDVLSFSMREEREAGAGGPVAFRRDPDLLGDIVISVDTAARQATEVGHSLGEELRVLLVHGFLHLCGYDHVEPGDAEEMRAEEAAMLGRLRGEGAGEGLVGRAMAGGR